MLESNDKSLKTEMKTDFCSLAELERHHSSPGELLWAGAPLEKDKARLWHEFNLGEALESSDGRGQ